MNSLSNLAEISRFRSKYLAAKLIMDTNVLLLLFVGNYNRDYIKDCPLMTGGHEKYTAKHFDLLKKIIDIFLKKNIVITPHVLSEVNMLTHDGRIKPPDRDPHFLKLIEQLTTITEHQIELEKLLGNTGIVDYGFTDMSIVEVAKEKLASDKWIILTDDGPLYREVVGTLPIISFSSIVASDIHGV